MNHLKSIHWVDWHLFDNRINFLVNQINEFERKEKTKFKNLYGIPRGGLYVAVRLSYLLKKPLITNKNKINDDTLIIDDCTKTGKTLIDYKNKGLKTLTLIHRPTTSKVTPTFYGFTTEEDANYFWEAEDDIN